MRGAVGWLRENLLSTPFNIALTIFIALLLAWIIPDLLRFLIVDAVWTGADRDACLEGVQHRHYRRLLAFRLGTLAVFRLRLLSGT